MRNLTVKRAKTFVACLVEIKLYIEDPASPEITINNVPCRKLGELKNGEEKTFSIGDQAAKVFAIVDQLSKEYCNEFYQLPDGQEDISLSGKNHFNPGNGNAFRFDNNTSEEVLANRKKGTRKGVGILITVALVGAVVGFVSTQGLFSNDSSAPKIFEADGIQITLTNDFRESKVDNYVLYCETEDMAMSAQKESFADYEGLDELSLQEYGDILLEGNGFTREKMDSADGIPCFEYSVTDPETKEEYHFIFFTYKSDDAFWVVQFVTYQDFFDELSEEIMAAAKSVQFT